LWRLVFSLFVNRFQNIEEIALYPKVDASLIESMPITGRLTNPHIHYYPVLPYMVLEKVHFKYRSYLVREKYYKKRALNIISLRSIADLDFDNLVCSAIG
jgi:hypothetical protein